MYTQINNKHLCIQITYELGNQIKADRTDGACRKYGQKKKYICRNFKGKPEENKAIWKREDIDWIHLDQNRNKWRALVNATMKIRVP
jgi:hypothetical protein